MFLFRKGQFGVICLYFAFALWKQQLWKITLWWGKPAANPQSPDLPGKSG